MDDHDEIQTLPDPNPSRLNARAQEFVPRTTHHNPRKQHYQPRQPRMAPIHPPPPVVGVFVPQVGPGFEGFADGKGDRDPGEGLPDDVVQKVTKQVEYYFSDINLATTEHLMRFISKDPDGFVPISVIAPFKKIKALVSTNEELAAALRTSWKLVVSDDGKRVRRQQPITDADLEELQAHIIVAENLPEDHSYQNLMKVFSVIGSVKTIRTCYPQPTNGAAPANHRPGKMDTVLFNKLHAFVEYETAEQAERAVAELNDERNWRSGLRVRLLPKNMRHGHNRGKKGVQEGEGNIEEAGLTATNQHSEKVREEQSEPIDASNEQIVDEGPNERDGAPRRGKGRGRGGKGRGRGQHNNNSRNGGHPVGSPSQIGLDHLPPTKQPPGPRMPDGTRGFTTGRGKPPVVTTT